MERERFVLRDETFGATLYDRKFLRHKFVDHEEIASGLEMEGAPVSKPERWRAETSGKPEDLLYAPTRIYFELTRECNLRCVHCFNSSAKALPDEMNTSEIMQSLDGLRRDNIFDLRFTGGELTVRPDWFDILKRAKDLDFAVSINTNGVFLDFENTIDKLAALELDQIAVSIDGTKEHHEQIRGKNTWDKAIGTLRVLKEKKGSA